MRLYLALPKAYSSGQFPRFDMHYGQSPNSMMKPTSKQANTCETCFGVANTGSAIPYFRFAEVVLSEAQAYFRFAGSYPQHEQAPQIQPSLHVEKHNSTMPLAEPHNRAKVVELTRTRT
jgi:hypothetical protein